MEKSKGAHFRFILSLAVKNLTRYKRRSLITAIAIAVGIMIYVTFDSILLGSQRDSELNLLQYEIAPTRIMDPLMKEDMDIMPMDYLMDQTPSLLAELDNLGYQYAPRTKFTADMVFYKDPFPEDGSLQVMVTALDPERDGEVFRLNDSLSQGQFLENGSEGLVMGEWLADDIGAEIGSFVTIVTRTRDGYYQTMDLEIIGFLNSPNPMVNRYSCLITLEMANDYLDTENAVSYIDIKTRYTRDALRGNTSVNKKWSEEVEPLRTLAESHGYELYSWDELSTDYLSMAKGDQYGTVVILFLVFIIAAVGISNTMLMAVMERRREIGMMESMGMTDGVIRSLFLLEAGGIGFLGSFSGLILGILANIPIIYKGIDFSVLMEDMDIGYRITGIMRGVWNPSAFIAAILAGTLIAMLTSWLSTRRILKTTIVNSLYGR